MTIQHLIVSLSICSVAPTMAFHGVTVMNQALHLHNHHDRKSHAPLSALIYGWDDDSVDEGTTYVTDNFSDTATQCTPVGAEFAESLSYDKDRVGSLARLAVAFSPPERALSLDILQKVDVICVAQDHIDIQAIICEDGGCVSLSVPVKFPYSCSTTNSMDVLQGCVIRNLQHLDESASSSPALLATADSNGSGDDSLLQSSNNIAFPSWWIPASAVGRGMEAECSSMKEILNEAEFGPDIIALAQSSLNNSQQQASRQDQYNNIQMAKVAAIGPSGLCFKVRAVPLSNPTTTHILDVLHPFGENLQTVEEMRAAVLGLVATAEA